MSWTSLRPRHIRRYRDIARLLIRHGNSDLLRGRELSRVLLDEDAEPGHGDPARLAADLEALGPTFIKLGQLLSTRDDLLPRPYLVALSRLQDRVAPMPWEMVEQLVQTELGASVGEVYASFDRDPIASASLGQVHAAVLANGHRVAVKVQRPGIAEIIRVDFEALDRIAELLDEHTEVGRRYAFRDMLEELQAVLLRELDYRAEAQNLERMTESLEDYPNLVSPRPLARLTTSRVLTMDYIDGTKLGDLTALGRTDLDGSGLALDLCRAYLEHILLEGFFHADPHPGNVLITPDGKLAMIDLGMVARLSRRFRGTLLKLVIAIAEGDGTAAAETCAVLGTRLEGHDPRAFERRVLRVVGRFQGASIERVPLGTLVFELAREAASCGIRPPAELTLVGKAMLHLDEVGRRLDPRIDTNAVMRDQLRWIAVRHLGRSFRPSAAFSTLVETREFLQQLPRRVNTVLDALTRREFSVRVQAFDESALLQAIQQLGTRITLGLVLAACIVGASLLMRVDTPNKILGYPALAIVLFLAAFAGGVILLIGLIVQEYRRRKHHDHRHGG